MPMFNSSNIELLKQYIYYSNIHDSKVEVLLYNMNEKSLTIKAVNSIFGEKIDFIFDEVKSILFLSNNEQVDHETIISLTVEEDYSLFKFFKNEYYVSKPVYLLFQMLSGDELHIISENVYIERLTDTDRAVR